MDSPLRDMETQHKYNDHNHCPEKDSPCGIEGSHRCCLCGSLQKESEWKVKVRDWWYSVQDAQKCPDEIKRVEIEHIIRETLAHRENEIAEEVEKMKATSSEPEEGWTEEEQALVDIHNEILDKVLQIIKH